MLFAARHSPTCFRTDAFNRHADDDSLFPHHALAKLRPTLVFAIDLALQVDGRAQGHGQGNDLGVHDVGDGNEAPTELTAGVKRLHFFGLKLSPDLVDLAPLIYSRDSAVALDDYDGHLRKQRNGRRWPVGQQEKRESFQVFFGRLDSLGLRYQNGSGK